MVLNIVIVTFNNERTIIQCLKSIFDSPLNSRADVILVDNDSTDQTVGVVKKTYPNVKLIKNKQNLGFAKANNQAIRKAQSKYIFLLNPDAQVQNDALGRMISYMEENKDVGILGPKLLSADSIVQKEITMFPKLSDSILVLLKLHRVKPIEHFVYPNYDYEKVQEVEHLMGSALLIRREVFDKIGLFDEKFFLWFEETDFEKIAKEAGFKLVYYPKAVIKHLVGQSTKQINPIKRQAIWNQSLRYYFQKHRPRLEQAILNFFIILSYLPAALLLLKEKLVNK